MLIHEALTHPDVFAPALEPVATWRNWQTVLRAADGVELDAQEAEFFASVAGGRSAPTAPVRALWQVSPGGRPGLF